MKFLATLAKGALATGTVAAGLSTGSWVNDQVHPTHARQGRTPATEAGLPRADIAPATLDSLFHYQFERGDRLDYAFDAAIRGTGVESLAGPGNIAMEFESDMYVITDSVDLDGNGNLTIGFDRVEMAGSFMEQPVSLMHSMAGTEFHHGAESVSTAQGDSIRGIPQLEFFNQPTRAKVSPAGTILRVDGAPGMERLLSPEEIITGVEFPEGDLDEGASWTSDFALPVPGMGTPASAQATNVLEGFELYRGRYCGVIRQTLNAQQDGGALHAPESALSEASDFSLPEFRLSGENLIYFDVDNGELVEATLNLDLTMQIGEQLKPVADMLNLYGQLLNEIDGLGAAPDGSGEALLDLGMNIQASLSLFMP